MIALARTLTGIGTTLLLVGGLLAGCGASGAPGMAKRPYGQTVGSRGMGAFGEDGDDAPAAGGLAPLPKPTAIPGAPAGGGGKKGAPNLLDPKNADDLYGVLRQFGFRGIKRQMVDAIEGATNSYPLGWDPKIDTQKHYDWWLRSFGAGGYVPKDYQSYVDDAVRLAQYRLGVIYYVWVSKQRPSDRARDNMPPPKIDFNQAIPVVKGIRGVDGWLVEISPSGTVKDFFEVDSGYLEDYNHVIPIPPDLY